jgi:uncharacterized membrane protein YfhO
VALCGVVAPAGSHELTFRYTSTWFLLGAVVSGLALIGIVLCVGVIRSSALPPR